MHFLHTLTDRCRRMLQTEARKNEYKTLEWNHFTIVTYLDPNFACSLSSHGHTGPGLPNSVLDWFDHTTCCTSPHSYPSRSPLNLLLSIHLHSHPYALAVNYYPGNTPFISLLKASPPTLHGYGAGRACPYRIPYLIWIRIGYRIDTVQAYRPD